MKKRTKKEELQRLKNFEIALNRISFSHLNLDKIVKDVESKMKVGK
jgi:hypothetical protein